MSIFAQCLNCNVPIHSTGAVVESATGLFIYSKIERWEGDRACICCAGPDVHGSGPLVTGRSHCEKPLSGTPALHS